MQGGALAEQGGEQGGIQRAQLGVLGEDGGVGAVSQDQPRTGGMGFPAGTVAHVVETLDGEGEPQGERARGRELPGDFARQLAQQEGLLVGRGAGEEQVQGGGGEGCQVVAGSRLGEGVELDGVPGSGAAPRRDRLSFCGNDNSAFGEQGSQVVARDTFSDYPEAAQQVKDIKEGESNTKCYARDRIQDI